MTLNTPSPDTGKTGKIQCGRCKAIVDFCTYRLEHADGRVLKDMVPILKESSVYVCQNCMEVLRSTAPDQLGTVHVTQFIAITKVREITSLVVRAHDLVMRSLSDRPGDDYKTDAAAWIEDYEAQRQED